MKKSEFITFRTDPGTKALLEGLAKSTDRTLSYVINRIIDNYLKLCLKESRPADKR